MAIIYNSELTKGLADSAKIQIAVDAVPSMLAEKVVPVVETCPKLLKITDILRTTDATGTIYAVPANKSFFLCGFTLNSGTSANVTATATITATIGGAATVIGRCSATGQAGGFANNSTCVNMRFPAKIDSGTNISLALSHSGNGGIYGYLEDNTA